jgi:nitrogen-specific signal transduction histidine kinase/CheY-like chemotaxis protein
VAFGAGRARLVQITDVTDRARTRAALHRSEEHLRQAQKMDALGRLAGGIAHDFNNLLTAIRGYSEMLLRDLPDDSNHRGDIDRIRQAADRGALLTRQLLALGSRQVLQPKAVDLNDVLAEMETLLQRLVGAEVRLGLVPTPGIGHVKIDPGQLEQVILNLVLNARDAMTGGGTLMIETSERNIRAPGRSRHVRPGRYVVLAVTDSGAGMDEETRTRMFEPFFTTKAANGGAGLGLSIVYGIVRQNGGVIRIASEPGSGTTVKVYLPRCVDCDEAAPSVAAPSHNGVETILLVEDEEAVRELLRKVLVHQGYTVLEARHGRDALLLLEEYRGPLDLVVTDVVMPEMGGREMVEHMLTARPDLQVLYISGYANEQLARRGVSEPEVSFIQKPFSSDEFVRKVRGLLDAVPPAI